ncbi:succinyldiaminopimelate aminotransferase apoenzyme [Quadrisphaera granulorum]|uniref:Succinyldiaminopimelate aminotransferase n=1 Tax=Quadrisphaera granulorum TaxID=317664 RepID=A0A316AH14_9ACTN|nr:succinyldiaminopimelate aminotransferase [Quadrisphaera granulorum]SZE94808.1 succinyldiaminopimelate aminotransferase apoenzyme [Quadrisphaera granulorum]
MVQRALRDAADAPGYPLTAGTPALREAAAGWAARSRGAVGLDPEAVLPTIGSKELVAWLPTLLGLGPGDVVVIPEVAYPTYDVGARLAGARAVAVPPGGWPTEEQLRGPDGAPGRVRLVWLNSPSNPTGAVAGVEQLRSAVERARAEGAVVASDECYAELAWDVEEVPSVLDPRVCGTGKGSHDGLLLVTSLSKRSNLAGYRGGAVLGDPRLVAQLLAVRKHAGMIVPAPVQAAVAAAFSDDEHVAVQRERYRARRSVLRAALEGAGLRVEHSEAGLYLWTRAAGAAGTASGSGWELLDRLADLGILVAPGDFYGPSASAHIRVALTASDERVSAAAARLAALAG